MPHRRWSQIHRLRDRSEIFKEFNRVHPADAVKMIQAISGLVALLNVQDFKHEDRLIGDVIHCTGMKKQRAIVFCCNLKQIKDCYLVIQPIKKYHHETFFCVLRWSEKI